MRTGSRPERSELAPRVETNGKYSTDFLLFEIIVNGLAFRGQFLCIISFYNYSLLSVLFLHWCQVCNTIIRQSCTLQSVPPIFIVPTCHHT